MSVGDVTVRREGAEVVLVIERPGGTTTLRTTPDEARRMARQLTLAAREARR